MEAIKRCGSCQYLRTARAFCPSSRTEDGLSASCRGCLHAQHWSGPVPGDPKLQKALVRPRTWAHSDPASARLMR